MKAVVFHSVGDIGLEDCPEPRIQNDEDPIVQLTASAICGTDLHFIRGSMHRRYLPDLIRMVANGTVRPSRILTKHTALDQAIEAYKAFDRHEDGWLKVELLPSSHAVAATKGEVVTA